MTPVATYVFLDLETTGFPEEEYNKTKIIELSMVAVKRQHLLDCRPGTAPRVQNKITLCFNPCKLVQPGSTKVTGLCNDLLEHETTFNREVFDIMNNFLNILTEPVCFIAQNGLNFDYPILRNHLEKLKVNFSDNLMCADCYHGFYDILEARNKRNCNIQLSIVENDIEAENTTLKDNIDILSEENTVSMQMQNEVTPKKPSKQVINTPVKKNKCKKTIHKACRRIPFSQSSKPTQSYKLKDIYERLLNRPANDAHHAENDCILALECSVVLGKDFVEWIDKNQIPFADVKPMTIGVRVGLLVLTGALWGCTNPFIRQGTKGLRSVKAKTRLGQAYAEIVFLLGNWRYVVPWLVNQVGSLVYLVAVQRAPLSLAVPTANSLAFAFTAITGAGIGVEEPLDAASILGIVFIASGTALCCWDKAD